jgi:ATP-dependent DNA helicase RecG
MLLGGEAPDTALRRRSRYFHKVLFLKKIRPTGTETSILATSIEYLKGVGPVRGSLLRTELGIHTFGDLLVHFPFRYLDRSRVVRIAEAGAGGDFLQLTGRLVHLAVTGEKRSRRLVATLSDGTGEMELVWFRGVAWIQKSLQLHQAYVVWGRPTTFNGRLQMAHPEMDVLTPENAAGKDHLDPVYSSTEKLSARGLTGRGQGSLTRTLLEAVGVGALQENLPVRYLSAYRLMPREQAFRAIHFPATEEQAAEARRRLKFEELFLAQVRICRLKLNRHRLSRGWKFEKVGGLFHTFYERFLPFPLTGAQKRVFREIRSDTLGGRQMNRLLQGDVGSGKTIVALLSVLLAADNGFQSCLMAPTEVLAQQHFEGISALLKDMGLRVALLSGNVKGKKRRDILALAASGELDLLIGTHALIEDAVVFRNLGLAVVDEQHRFGVQQRAKLWAKNSLPPHVLVMTATPIPRTLAMTVYGDLDVSVIDELPPGRKPVQTVHRPESHRGQVMSFIRGEIAAGRQAYIVYPLIQESEKLDYENLEAGYQTVKAYFPEPQYRIAMVHGRQPQEQKQTNMKRFVSGDCQIMVATTVIEVGVNVPNASVMVIESAERFGLSQLHLLRGRVGRGADKSYCILMTTARMSRESARRIRVMEQSANGFEISEKDLELRGPGDLEGTRQSGALNLRLADLVADRDILEASRAAAVELLEEDPDLRSEEHQCLRRYLLSEKDKNLWSMIS